MNHPTPIPWPTDGYLCVPCGTFQPGNHACARAEA